MLASIQLNRQYTDAVNMVVGKVLCMALSVLCKWDRTPRLHTGARDSAEKPAALFSAYIVSIPCLEHTAVGSLLHTTAPHRATQECI